MQLEKNEHSLLAYFPSSNAAEKAAQELQKAGLVPSPDSIQIDRISRYGVNHNSEYNNPLNNAYNLSGVTAFSGDSSREGSNPLLAADPSASGIGAPGYGLAGGHAFLLTLVTDTQHTNQAVEIVKANGGQV